MRFVGLGSDSKRVRVAEVWDHHLQLLVTIGDPEPLPLHFNQLPYYADRFLRIARPVVRVFPPLRIFRRIVVLLDGLKENFHPRLVGESRHVANPIQVMRHDDVLEANNGLQLVFSADPFHRLDGCTGLLPKLVAPANRGVQLADPID